MNYSNQNFESTHLDIEYIEDFPKYFDELNYFIKGTDNAYNNLLVETCKEFNLDIFAPWQLQYAIHQYENRLQKYNDKFLVSNIIPLLLKTFKDLGFDFKEDDIYVTTTGFIDNISEVTKYKIIFYFNQDKGIKQYGRYYDIGNVDLKLPGKIEVNLWDKGIESYGIVFHEFGHAIHFLNITNYKYQLLRTNFPTYFSEGLAKIIESVVFDSDWIHRNWDIDKNGVDEIIKAKAILELFTLRINAFLALFEISSYDLKDSPVNLWKYLSKNILYPQVDLKDLFIEQRAVLDNLFHNRYSAFDTVYAILIREHLKNFFK